MNTPKTGLGQRRLTTKQRQRLLARYHERKLTLKQFATQHGVGLSTLSKWLRLERDAVPPKVKFQEVRLPPQTARWPVEVVSPQGWIVRLQSNTDVYHVEIAQLKSTGYNGGVHWEKTKVVNLQKH